MLTLDKITHRRAASTRFPVGWGECTAHVAYAYMLAERALIFAWGRIQNKLGEHYKIWFNQLDPKACVETDAHRRCSDK